MVCYTVSIVGNQLLDIPASVARLDHLTHLYLSQVRLTHDFLNLELPVCVLPRMYIYKDSVLYMNRPLLNILLFNILTPHVRVCVSPLATLFVVPYHLLSCSYTFICLFT